MLIEKQKVVAQVIFLKSVRFKVTYIRLQTWASCQLLFFIIITFLFLAKTNTFGLQVVTALGRTWHPEHFSCAHCQKELGTKNFFERDGQPYCEPDYHHLFSPRCSYCNGPILDVRQFYLNNCRLFALLKAGQTCFLSF